MSEDTTVAPPTLRPASPTDGTTAGTRAQGPGLRERKKQATRQLLSDTATEMFLARGFDHVRVSEIAEACQVSEKTVFNYFPSKEALLLDRIDASSDALLAALADPATSPVRAAVAVLADELATRAAQLATDPDFRRAADRYVAFGALLRSTPALRAYANEMTEHLTTAVAEIVASRTGRDAEDPEPRITAAAVMALWPVQYRSFTRHLATAMSTDEVAAAVTADVRRAAAALENGLRV